MSTHRCRFLLAVLLTALPQVLDAQKLSPAEQEVWRRELNYWDFRSTGKIAEYLSLWDEDFVGWPSISAQPGGKAIIRTRIERDVADTQSGSFTFQLESPTVRIFGDIASVFYRARYSRLDKAGARIDSYVRITHTWRRSAGVWRIISGMAANEPNR